MNIPIKRDTRAKIAALAHMAMPYELCGVIVGDEFIPAVNLHEDPENNFLIDPRLWVDLDNNPKEIKCIVHSHTKINQDTFSPSDVASCKELGLPWYLFCTQSGKEIYYNPQNIEDLIGREWHYGLWDCYSLVKDYYEIKFGNILSDYKRGEDLEWLLPDWNMFEENFQAEEFKEISPDIALQPGDIIMMQIGGCNINHIGVINESGNLLHHAYGRLSNETAYGGYWLKHTQKRVRLYDKS